jgi:cellulose biosynthesis protein BcsQ
MSIARMSHSKTMSIASVLHVFTMLIVKTCKISTNHPITKCGLCFTRTINQYKEYISIPLSLINFTRMASIIAFVSQTGNVMKTTLTAAVGLTLAAAGTTVQAYDLDLEHFMLGESLKTWLDDRAQRQKHLVQMPCRYWPNAASALAAAAARPADEIVLIDCPSRATEATAKIVRQADFVVIPQVPGNKDKRLLEASLAALLASGADPTRMAFIFTRTGSAAETRAFQLLLKANPAFADIPILAASIPEQVGYRMALAKGLAITEAQPRSIADTANAAVDAIISAYLAATDADAEADLLLQIQP